MKKNISTVIEFNKGQICIRVVEKIFTNDVAIFCACSPIDDARQFLLSSISIIKEKIGGNIQNVDVIVESSKNFNANISLTKKRMQVFGNHISENDINNLVDITKEEIRDDHKTIILIQALQFEVTSDNDEKAYSEAPIGKKANFLTGSFAVTMIDNNVASFINNTLEACNLKINQIATSVQAISFAKLSSAALKSGTNLIHIGKNSSFISINKNGGVVASLELFNFGFNSLIKVISEKFNCSKNEAKNLFYVYGSLLTNQTKRVIYSRQQGIKLTDYYNTLLTQIIESFISRMLSITTNFLNSKNISHLPIVFSGFVEYVDGFEKYISQKISNDFSIYTPLSFIELDKRYERTIGLDLLKNRLEFVFGKNLKTIVETNPNLMSSLKIKKTKNLFLKIFNNIGGKYERNN